MTRFEIISIILSIFTLIAASYFAHEQTEINKKVLKNHSFTELFIYPINDSPGLLILRNVSSTPIYLESYKFGNTTTSVGKACIPNTNDCYWQLHIPQENINDKKFDLEVIFYDLENNKYLSKHSGKLGDRYWTVSSQKNEQVK